MYYFLEKQVHESDEISSAFSFLNDSRRDFGVPARGTEAEPASLLAPTQGRDGRRGEQGRKVRNAEAGNGRRGDGETGKAEREEGRKRRKAMRGKRINFGAATFLCRLCGHLVIFI